MIIDFGKRVGEKNKGSCSKLVTYLEKENEEKEPDSKRYFFSHNREGINPDEVIKKIDCNHKKFKKHEAKYYMLVISPSQKELRHINSSEKSLMDYTRAYMDSYARNFNKGLTGEDLVYFAKIEEFRTDKKTGAKKSGLNWHVHVIVSRMDMEMRYSISPWTNHINTTKGPIKGGFYRNSSRQASERIFDRMFGYSRGMVETFDFQNETRKEREEKERKMRIEKSSIASLPKVTFAADEIFSLLLPNVNTEWIYDFDQEEIKRRRRRKKTQSK